MDDSARDKLEEWCRENKVRIECYAEMGQGSLGVEYVDDIERAKVIVEVEER